MRKEIEQRENIISENKKDFDTQKVRFKINLDSLDKKLNHMIWIIQIINEKIKREKYI